MGSRLPPTTLNINESCDRGKEDESSYADLTEMTSSVMESSESIAICSEKRQTSNPSSIPSAQVNHEITRPVTDHSPSVDKLIPSEKRVNGVPFGTVIGHTYTDNKNTNLENWLPDALNQTAIKRKVLMDLEQTIVKFIAEETNQPFLELKASDTYQRLAIYRVTAYFGLSCRPKDGDFVAYRTPHTRIPEDNIRFEAMLGDLREDRDVAEHRIIDHLSGGGDMRSMQNHSHIRDSSAVFYNRQPYSPLQLQPMRFRNPNVHNRFGPSHPPFPMGMSSSNPLSTRVPPPIRRFYGSNTRFRGSLPPDGNFVNNHHLRWVASGEVASGMPTYDNSGNSGTFRSQSAPNINSGVPYSANVSKSMSGHAVKPWENQLYSHNGQEYEHSAGSSVKASNDATSGQDTEFESVQTEGIIVACSLPTSSGPLLSDNRIASGGNATLNKEIYTCSRPNEENSINKYNISHQMAAMTIDASTKDTSVGIEGMDKLTSSSTTLLSTASTSSSQSLQDLTYGNDYLTSGPQSSISPVRMGTPLYPPPMTVPRPSTLNVYNTHSYTPQTMAIGQPTMLMMTDTQGYIQASPQIGHTYPVAAAVSGGPTGSNALEPSSAVPVLQQPQSVFYIAPQQLSHQAQHQTPSIIYLNPVQPNPVISGQSPEYTLAQYRDMPPPTTGLPPPQPPPSMPYSPYQPLQQIVTSAPPPAAGGVTYYATPSEMMYTGANTGQQLQTAGSQEYVQYSTSTLPIAGYTFSPYLPQQVNSSAATPAGYVNYFPTAAAYPGTYATSTPLVFQSAAGFSVPPPPTEITRLPSEMQRPIQWVPMTGTKGSGFMPTVHITPTTSARGLTVGDVHLVGQPITVHPFVPVAQLANQRMESGVIQAAYQRLPPPAQATYHKSASYGIRPSVSGSPFRSAAPPTFNIPTRPSSVQYQ